MSAMHSQGFWKQTSLYFTFKRKLPQLLHSGTDITFKEIQIPKTFQMHILMTSLPPRNYISRNSKLGEGVGGEERE